MNIPDDRIAHEIGHGEKIASMAEYIWGWETPAGLIRVERRANFFIQSGNISKGTEVLELGCGTGVFTERVARTGADMVAVDVSPDLIAIAKKRVPHKNVGSICVSGSSPLKV